ncbi:MAG TPA: aminoglycoside phosphotransferase family protein [candidate division Zixibacteria bacterium]|nr:aminoglycoside phosphotransferase family protein [candidate division Zixibacteria bacterium]
MEFTENKIQQIIREKLSLQVHSITENTKGIDQDVWIIETNEQKIVLKHPKNNNKIRNNREVIACNLLAKLDIIVPQILYVDDQILIETFLEGNLVDQVDFSKVSRYDLYFNAGQILEKIHSITTTNFGMVTDDSLVGEFSTQVEYLQADLGELLNLEKTPFYSQEDIKQVLQYFESNKSILENSPSVLLHADYSDSNLVYTPDGKIAVIDFGDLSIGNPMLDVTKMYLDHIGDGAFQAFIDGYGEINIEQVKLFALCWLIWLIPALWKRNNSQERVKRLCHVFESIWK